MSFKTVLCQLFNIVIRISSWSTSLVIVFSVVEFIADVSNHHLFSFSTFKIVVLTFIKNNIK